MKTISVGGGTVILPNVSFCEDTKNVYYNPNKTIPIPIEGDVQIFADSGCTQYATGSEKTVYVRVNKSFGFGEVWRVFGSSSGDNFMLGTPTTEAPEDFYNVIVWDDWLSDDFSTPFTASQVVECTNRVEEWGHEFTPVSNPTVIFSKP